MALLELELCILDESDSGLDIDALKEIVAEGVNALRDDKRAFIIVTTISAYWTTSSLITSMSLYQGRIVRSGDFTLRSNNWRSRGYG